MVPRGLLFEPSSCLRRVAGGKFSWHDIGLVIYSFLLQWLQCMFAMWCDVISNPACRSAEATLERIAAFQHSTVTFILIAASWAPKTECPLKESREHRTEAEEITGQMSALQLSEWGAMVFLIFFVFDFWACCVDSRCLRKRCFVKAQWVGEHLHGKDFVWRSGLFVQLAGPFASFSAHTSVIQ